jgi:putative aminopeptidase FrvX
VRVLNDKDYRLFEKLVSLTEKGMLQAMNQYLKTKYDNIITTKDYIIAVGSIPIALVAHMDTVFKTPVSDLYYDAKKGVMWSPDGLGADDRAGIFAIIKILQDGLRPSIILTTGEEEGGIGACAVCEKYPQCPIPGLKYMIQLDRHGTNDCVFYDCYCPEFVDYV